MTTTESASASSVRYVLQTAGDGSRDQAVGLDVEVLNEVSGELIAAVSIDWGRPPDLRALPSFAVHWSPSAAVDPEGAPSPHWAVTGHFGESDRGVIIRDLCVMPVEDMDWVDERDPDLLGIPEGGLTTRVLRQIPLGAVYGTLRTILTSTEEDPDFGWMHSLMAHPDAEALRQCVEHLKAVGIGSSLAPRVHRDANRPALLRDVAIAYIDAADQPGAHQRLAKQFGKSTATVRDWIHQAREQGWLAPGAKGRRGAMPGYRLIEERDRSQHRISTYGTFQNDEVIGVSSPSNMIIEMQSELVEDGSPYRSRDVEVYVATSRASHEHQFVPRLREWELDYRVTHDVDPFETQAGRDAYLARAQRLIKLMRTDVVHALEHNEVKMPEELWKHQQEKHASPNPDTFVDGDPTDG